MNPEQLLTGLLGISEDASIADALKAKIATGKQITIVHPFEPNGRINIAQVNQIAISHKIAMENGCKFVVYICDVAASLNHAFQRDKSKIEAASQYAINALKASGVDGPNTEYIISDKHTIDNFPLFCRLAEITTHIPAAAVQKALPPMGKKERDTLTASQIYAPILTLTELCDIGADIIITTAERQTLYNLVSYVAPENTPIVIPIRPIMKLKGVKSNPPKPDPKNTVFYEDDEPNLTKKILGAFCTDDIKDNPVYEYIAFGVLRRYGSFEFNGKTYTNIEELGADFPTMEKKPLKEALAAALNKMADPVRNVLSSPDFAEICGVCGQMTTAH